MSHSANATRRSRIVSRWAPTAEGLPNRRVLFVPLIAMLIVFLGLVAAGITGSSSGILNADFNSQPDPNKLLGSPQAIRSDEWGVNTSWIISQIQQGLPVTNSNFDGSVDTTVLQDLPSTDWSMAFRPHLAGFLFLPVDNAFAVKWWLPAFALLAAMYVFAVTLMPRRPVTSLLLAGGFLFAPFFQWWFGANTHWPVAWALLLMSSVVWLMRSKRRSVRIVWPIIVGYLAVTVGMTLYVPFIVPVTLVALVFAVGYFFTGSSSDLQGAKRRLKSVWGLFAAAGAAAIILVVWMVTRLDTIRAFSSTVYPGERLQATGEATLHDFVSLFSGPFSFGLGKALGVPFGLNASESSTFMLVGLFLAVPALWLVVGQIRRRTSIDWLLVSLLALGAVLLAFLVVPGWDALAHILFLDRVPVVRLRLAFGLLSMALIVVVVRRFDERRVAGERSAPWWVLAISAGAAVVVYAGVAADAIRYQTQVTTTLVWIPMVLVSAAAAVLLIGRRPVLGAAAFAIVSLIGGGLVNPIYAGVYNLNGTTLLREMKAINAERPGSWLGAGNTPVVGMALVQSGLPAFNGVQTAPSEEMWKRIDPDGSHEKAWNRLGNVSWGVGDGPPNPINPSADQIRLIFDSCETFAQENVQYVLSEFDIQQPCVNLLKAVKQGPSTFYIFEVVARP